MMTGATQLVQLVIINAEVAKHLVQTVKLAQEFKDHPLFQHAGN